MFRDVYVDIWNKQYTSWGILSIKWHIRACVPGMNILAIMNIEVPIRVVGFYNLLKAPFPMLAVGICVIRPSWSKDRTLKRPVTLIQHALVPYIQWKLLALLYVQRAACGRAGSAIAALLCFMCAWSDYSQDRMKFITYIERMTINKKGLSECACLYRKAYPCCMLSERLI